MKKVKKILTNALWVYLLTLLVLPCNDNCGSESHEQPITMEQAQDHHEEENDLCTPFCICSCCATPVLVDQVSDLELNIAEFAGHSDYYHSSFSSYSHSIWQPPKIVS
ncbi:MAG TPA: DUF6660 family protein [Bacteroidia bacterium]|jgi:hypothetical protein